LEKPAGPSASNGTLRAADGTDGSGDVAKAAPVLPSDVNLDSR
jgi:hypothetical protein